MEFSVISLADKIKTEADAYKLLEDLRWKGRPVCPHCDSERVYFLTPKSGTDSRKTRTGSESQRRVWKCGACRKQFSALTNTIFHGTKISLRKWLSVIFEMCANKNGISAREIERRYDLAPKSAWFMTHRIREAMKSDPLAGMLTGTIVADETYFGGTPRLSHQHRDRAPEARFVDRRTKQHRKPKTPVFTLVHKETGEARSVVMPNVDGANLAEVLAKNVNMSESVLHTDEAAMYQRLGRGFQDHQSVSHGLREYVRGDVSTNQAENFFSQLKRSIDGTHHAVSEEHLHRYLAEFDYRYSTRKMSDTERMNKLMGQVGGRRLTYKATI